MFNRSESRLQRALAVDFIEVVALVFWGIRSGEIYEVGFDVKFVGVREAHPLQAVP